MADGMMGSKDEGRRGKPKLAATDSKVYKHTFYGILNAYGDFWTQVAFETEDDARDHIKRFWRNVPDKAAECLRTHKIVPVRVRLNQLPDPNTPHTKGTTDVQPS